VNKKSKVGAKLFLKYKSMHGIIFEKQIRKKKLDCIKRESSIYRVSKRPESWLNKTSPAALLIGRLKNYCQSHNIPHIK
jgi:hypothetical protein